MCINCVFTRVFILFYSFLHRVHLQEIPSQDFIKRLKERRLGADFTWAGRLFQIFGPKTLKLLSPYFTWFGPVTLRFKTFCFRTGFFESDKLEISVIKAGLRRFIVLCISKQRQRNLTIVIVLFFALSKSGSSCFWSHCTTVAKPSYIYSLLKELLLPLNSLYGPWLTCFLQTNLLLILSCKDVLSIHWKRGEEDFPAELIHYADAVDYVMKWLYP